MINLSKEIAEHIIWNVRLRCFLEGKECISEADAISDAQCRLGIWLNTAAKNIYGDSPVLKDLINAHRELHDTVKQIIQLKNAKKTAAAQRKLMHLETVSKNIINLLTLFDDDETDKQE